MDKKSRSARTSSQGTQAAPGHETERDSCPIGERGSDTWVNERGEICIGSECFNIAIKPDADEVIVRVDRNKCGANLEPFIDTIFNTIGKGGRTVYESVSRVKPKGVKIVEE
jgi:hypothetical protein